MIAATPERTRWEWIPTPDSESLTMQVRKSGVVTEFLLKGELYVYTADWFRKELERHLTPDCPSLTIDLRETSLVDAHSWGILLRFLKRARELGGNICLVIKEGKNLVRKVFELTSMDKVFAHKSTVAEATQYLLSAA